MIVGTGVDLCEVRRIKAAMERYDDRFTQRVYTEGEIAYCNRKANRYERYAARFAAKEAAMKAIGTGMRGGVRWRDFEVTNLRSGRPTMAFHGKAAEYAKRLGVANVSLSMTHTAEQAMAMVILESAS